MRLFTDLYFRLDSTTKTNERLKALRAYFETAAPEDAVWALYYLTGHRPRRVVSGTLLREWASAKSGLPVWLLEECHSHVGDLAETLALVLPDPPAPTELPLHRLIADTILTLQDRTDDERRTVVEGAWARLTARERLVWHKLITGEFRIGVSSTLVVRALAEVADVPPPVMAHRVMGHWSPTPDAWARIVGADQAADPAQPFPFFLAYPLDPEDAARAAAGAAPALGAVDDWQIEWKWDGIRAQLLRRRGDVMLWSRGEDLVTHRFPEIVEAARRLPDGLVLDGEILAWGPEGVRPFGHLQRRLGRKNVGAALVAEVPVAFLAYDLLEEDGEDLRALPMKDRRARLERIAAEEGFGRGPLKLSPIVPAPDWAAVSTAYHAARDRGTEGLMLKRKDAAYGVGRTRGAWWKWKTAPYEMDAVLVYAQGGHGRRAGLYTDYTFAVWDKGALVPVAKAYSGLSDEEIRRVDAFIRRNTLDKHGPVRVVKPELVFQIAFEGINASSRHKAGLAVRFPRMARWREDKRATDADSLETLKALLAASERRAAVA